MQMSSISQDASSHIVTIRSVQFEVSTYDIVQLLGLPCAFEALTTMPIEIEGTRDVG